MPFTIEDLHDLMRLLEQRPEWRAELRRQILTEELLGMPQQLLELRLETERRFQGLAEAQRRTDERLDTLTARMDALTERMDTLTARMETLAEAQIRTEQALQALTHITGGLQDRVGRLSGDMLELRYRERAAAYLARILKRIHTLTAQELANLLDDAVEAGQLSPEEKHQVLLADVVVRGRSPEDGTPVYLVVEVSSGVGAQDGERAIERVRLLAKLGVPAWPVVARYSVNAEADSLARRHKVWQVTDGQAIRPT